VEITLTFIGAVILFLPLFVFLPTLIWHGLHVDVDRVVDAFGKNNIL
jgi:hypothetical protein